MDTQNPSRAPRVVAWAWRGAFALVLLGLLVADRPSVSTLGRGILAPELLGPICLAMVAGELCRADVEERRLPNALVLPGYAAGAAGLCLAGFRDGAVPVTAVVTASGVLAFLVLLYAGGGFGAGDVKLGGALGLAFGWLGPACAIAGVFLSFTAAGIAAIAVMLTGGGRRADLAFGPFLLAGFWAAATLAWPASGA